MSDPNKVVSHNLLSALEPMGPQISAIVEAWSDERMAAAAPLELPSIEARAADQEAMDKVRPPDGPGQLDDLEPEDDVPPALLDAMGPRFRTERVAPARLVTHPYQAVGKLFLRVAGSDRVATAFATGPRAVVTAGHCVYSDEFLRWAEEPMFAPGYDGGAPLGKWPAVSLHTLAGWKAQGNDARLFDIGGLRLAEPLPVQPIECKPGLSPAQGQFHSVGFPWAPLSTAYAFDGERMWYSQGDQTAVGAIQRMANNMTQGASGGPWLVAKGAAIYANGVNSFRLSNEPNTLASPYFGTGIANLVSVLTQAG